MEAIFTIGPYGSIILCDISTVLKLLSLMFSFNIEN